MKKEIPVLLITGYLGSGKTTLLNRLLSNRQGLKAAVIVNDIGEINVDASLIARGGVVGQNPQDVNDLIALQNGCICCSLQSDLIEQVMQLAESANFHYIIIEASGICEPEPIAQTLCAISSTDRGANSDVTVSLDCICSVVDTLRLRDEFGCGVSLSTASKDEATIEGLVVQQIEFSNVVVLNKISEVSAQEAAQVKAVVKALQPVARIVEADFADIDFNLILNTGDFDFERTATSATWITELEGHHDDDDDDDDEHEHHDHHEGHHHHHHHHHHDGSDADDEHGEEYGIDTMVYYRRRGFNINSFDRFLAQSWPKNIIRTKGVVYFTHNDDVCYLFEQAGRQKRLTDAGLWYATADEAEIARLRLTDPNLDRDWDETYGDRMIKLVIIGQHLDRKAITEALDKC